MELPNAASDSKAKKPSPKKAAGKAKARGKAKPRSESPPPRPEFSREELWNLMLQPGLLAQFPFEDLRHNASSFKKEVGRLPTDQEEAWIAEFRRDYKFWAVKLKQSGYQLPTDDPATWLAKLDIEENSIGTFFYYLLQQQQQHQTSYLELCQSDELIGLLQVFEALEELEHHGDGKFHQQIQQTRQLFLPDLRQFREKDFILSNLGVQKAILDTRADQNLIGRKNGPLTWNWNVPENNSVSFKKGNWQSFIAVCKTHFQKLTVSEVMDTVLNHQFFSCLLPVIDPLPFFEERMQLIAQFLKEGDCILFQEEDDDEMSKAYFIHFDQEVLSLTEVLTVSVKRVIKE
jgi:hypothetical protein